MKRKIFSILFALVLVLSLGLVTAVPASAAGTPAIDGTVSAGEWNGALEIPVASSMGTVKLLASTDYLFVLFDVTDSTDARLGQNLHGNDQTSININPTDGGAWGFPYDLIFETSADLPWNPKDNSGIIDGWNTRWFPNDAQEALPVDLESATIYSGGKRITEWKLPLATIAPLPGDTLLVGGATEAGDAAGSYVYPVGLDWNVPATFEDVVVPIPEPIEVEIDIKPGSFPNSINPKSKGVIPVAILTTAAFDATTVDASTVTFGPGAATMVHKNAHLEDVDGDGDIDMVLHFKTQETGIAQGDTSATLTGETYGGTPIAGTDTVKTVGK